MPIHQQPPPFVIAIAPFMLLLLLNFCAPPITEAAPFVLGEYLDKHYEISGFFKVDLQTDQIVAQFNLQATGAVASATTGLLYAYRYQYPVANLWTIQTVDVNKGQVIHTSPQVNVGDAGLVAFDERWNALVVGTWTTSARKGLSFWIIDPFNATKVPIFTIDLLIKDNSEFPAYLSYDSETRIVTAAFTSMSDKTHERLLLIDLDHRMGVGSQTLPTGPYAYPAWKLAVFSRLHDQWGAVLGLNQTADGLQLSAFNLGGPTFVPLGPRVRTFVFYNCPSVDHGLDLFMVWAMQPYPNGPALATWSLSDGAFALHPIKPWSTGQTLGCFVKLVYK